MECLNCKNEIADGAFSIGVTDVGDLCSEFCYAQYYQAKEKPSEVKRNLPPALERSLDQ